MSVQCLSKILQLMLALNSRHRKIADLRDYGDQQTANDQHGIVGGNAEASLDHQTVNECRQSAEQP